MTHSIEYVIKFRILSSTLQETNLPHRIIFSFCGHIMWLCNLISHIHEITFFYVMDTRHTFTLIISSCIIRSTFLTIFFFKTNFMCYQIFSTTSFIYLYGLYFLKKTSNKYLKSDRISLSVV